jgi:hypothetical protein
MPGIAGQRAVMDARAMEALPIAGSATGAPSPPLHTAPPQAQRTPSRLDLGALPQVALIGALGFAMIVYAYSVARTGGSHASVLYWVGEGLLFIPFVARALLARRLGTAEAVGLAVMAALLQYLVRVAYSPLHFDFPDEMAHWRTATDILQTHHLFTHNYLLPISPAYPGLEILTAAVSALGGVSVFTAGLLVIGVEHTLFALGLYLLFERITRSSRMALLGTLVYATNSHYQFFDSFFIYQAAALPVLVFVLLLLAHHGGPRRLHALASGSRLAAATVTPAMASPRVLRVLAVLGILVVVVTHHVTGAALAAILMLLAVFDVLRRRVGWSLVAATVAIAAVATWVVGSATSTVDYLSPALGDLLDSAQGLLSGHASTVAAAAPAAPIGERLLAYAATGLIVVCLPWAALNAWRWPGIRGPGRFFAVCALSYYLALAARLVSADGAELAGRLLTFIYLPMSIVFAIALVQARATRRVPTRITGVAATAFVAILFLGGIASGWPPSWERLPGPYQVSGLERSVTSQNLRAADWMLATHGPGNRMAVDLANYGVMGGYGDQDVIRNMSRLYYSASLLPSDKAAVAEASVRFVLVDRRLTQGLPVSGRYFPNDPRAYRHVSPLAPSGLAKFDHIDGVDRLYDNGAIQVFDLAGSPSTR